MSVRKRDDRGGQYEVRWREGGRQRSRLFGKKGDAQASSSMSSADDSLAPSRPA